MSHAATLVSPTDWVLHFTVPGPLVGKARSRFVKKTGHTYMPDNHTAWEAMCVMLARRHWPFSEAFDGPTTLRVRALFKRPQALRRKKDRGVLYPYVGKPDADNAAGLPMDALVKAGVLRDDTRVANLEVIRQYVPLLDDGTEPVAPQTEIWLAPWRPA